MSTAQSEKNSWKKLMNQTGETMWWIHYHSSFYFDGVWSERQNVEIVTCELLEHLLKPELPKDAFKSEIYDKTTNTGVM